MLYAESIDNQKYTKPKSDCKKLNDAPLIFEEFMHRHVCLVFERAGAPRHFLFGKGHGGNHLRCLH
jgi:hypothetical protein